MSRRVETYRSALEAAFRLLVASSWEVIFQNQKAIKANYFSGQFSILSIFTDTKQAYWRRDHLLRQGFLNDCKAIAKRQKKVYGKIIHLRDSSSYGSKLTIQVKNYPLSISKVNHLFDAAATAFQLSALLAKGFFNMKRTFDLIALLYSCSSVPYSIAQ